MQTRIQRWGNSLGLRIPKSFAAEADVTVGSTVDLSIENGQLIVRPISKPEYDLDELLEQVHSRNIHKPVDFGPPAGRESW